MTTARRPFCKEFVWRGRQAVAFGNDLVRMVILPGGGHIAEFRFHESTGYSTTNPLWTPPWKTIDPYRYRPRLHTKAYGTLTEGKLLSGIAGHSICLDFFGLPSKEEVKVGLSLHGEAPNSRWRKTSATVTKDGVSVGFSVRLPAARLRFTREMKLRRGESVVYFKETVSNQKPTDHFLHWTQHVSLGPPFLSRRDCTIAIPAGRGKTFPHGYDEGRALLPSSKEFRWPRVPALSGETIDLRNTLLKRGLGFVVGLLTNSASDYAYVAALNKRMRLLLGYCFNRSDYPWVAIWEENRSIRAVPWKGRTEARGLEFGTTPFPVERREAFLSGRLFGVPTLTCVPANSEKTIRYAAFLSAVPSGFQDVTNVQTLAGRIQVRSRSNRNPLHVPASGLAGS